jgi:hypothetical protein
MGTTKGYDIDRSKIIPTIEVIDVSASEMPFGEYLVQRGAVTRAQLLAALCAQDTRPGVPLGELLAWLGYLRGDDLEALLTEWRALPSIDLV